MSETNRFHDFIRRVRSGDEHAARELVDFYEPLVRRELRIKMTDRRLSQLFDSEDVCQSIWSSFFVRAAAGQYDLESPQQLAKLLSTMARNKLASQARRYHAEKRDLGRIDRRTEALATLPDAHETPSTCLRAKELYAIIQDRMTEEERKVSELRRDGSTWQAVAEALGGTAQSRRMQLDRAAERILGLLGLDEKNVAADAPLDR